MFPAMDAVWAALPCAAQMHYQDMELFPDAVPSEDYVASLCDANYFVRDQQAITWRLPPHQNASICDTWHPSVCLLRRNITQI